MCILKNLHFVFLPECNVHDRNPVERIKELGSSCVVRYTFHEWLCLAIRERRYLKDEECGVDLHLFPPLRRRRATPNISSNWVRSRSIVFITNYVRKSINTFLYSCLILFIIGKRGTTCLHNWIVFYLVALGACGRMGWISPHDETSSHRQQIRVDIPRADHCWTIGTFSTRQINREKPEGLRDMTSTQPARANVRTVTTEFPKNQVFSLSLSGMSESGLDGFVTISLNIEFAGLGSALAYVYRASQSKQTSVGVSTAALPSFARRSWRLMYGI